MGWDEPAYIRTATRPLPSPFALRSRRRQRAPAEGMGISAYVRHLLPSAETRALPMDGMFEYLQEHAVAAARGRAGAAADNDGDELRCEDGEDDRSEDLELSDGSVSGSDQEGTDASSDGDLSDDEQPARPMFVAAAAADVGSPFSASSTISTTPATATATTAAHATSAALAATASAAPATAPASIADVTAAHGPARLTSVEGEPQLTERATPAAAPHHATAAPAAPPAVAFDAARAAAVAGSDVVSRPAQTAVSTWVLSARISHMQLPLLTRDEHNHVLVSGYFVADYNFPTMHPFNDERFEMPTSPTPTTSASVYAPHVREELLQQIAAGELQPYPPHRRIVGPVRPSPFAPSCHGGPYPLANGRALERGLHVQPER
jgi:hypothetical protein